MKISLYAIGKVRGPEAEWSDEYLKRLRGTVTVKEMTVSRNLSSVEGRRAEAELLLKALPEKGLVVLLDERGKDLSSREFAERMKQWQDQSVAQVSFIIGGAGGVAENVCTRANFVLGFGRLTWPHRLVRVMLLEQLYRAQQINAGHPYHRD